MIVLRFTDPRFDKTEQAQTFCLRQVSSTPAPPGWIHPPRFLYHHTLIYVVEGTLYLRQNDAQMELSENDYVFAAPFTRICSGRASEAGSRFYTVAFDTDGTMELPRPHEKHHYSGGGTDAAQLLRAVAGPDDAHAQIACLFLLSELRRDAAAQQLHPMIPAIAEYIRAHLAQPLDQAALSAAFHYSGDYISRSFKAGCGVTLKQFITRAKIEAAKQMLAASALSTAQIGRTVGFADPALFRKFFKYHTGVSPSSWRKR